MPNLIISEQLGAVTSLPFKVKAIDLPLGVSSTGLDGAEEVVIHRKQADGSFRALSDATATMTATEPDTVIEATGTYRLVKAATVGNAGASIG